MTGFLNTGVKAECSGCEACAQACPVSAITMASDEEGFRYPQIDDSTCIHCGRCHKVCPAEFPIERGKDPKTAFGGHCKDLRVLEESTSGGAFSAIADSWCDENYAIFGAASQGLSVAHTYIEDKQELSRFRRSKYLQSEIGTAYADAGKFLKAGKKVLFSGTPCQIAGLRGYLGNARQDRLLTVEVACEGVPTPHYIQKLGQFLSSRHGTQVTGIDYRHKQLVKRRKRIAGKWDFEAMGVTYADGTTQLRDRWLNPFWSIWLGHLMSRPSCYKCPYACPDRVADITLGDLWGVHLYCPELYNHNAGASLVVCNTQKGRTAFEAAKSRMEGHELSFETALKYQGAMRNHIADNPNREMFMKDVRTMDYETLCEKWAAPPSLKLLWQKYVWGNRQKVWLWNLKNRRKS